MKNSLHVIWKWVKWPVLVVGFLYAVLVGFRTFMLFDEDKTAQEVQAIHAQRLTLADVTGDTLIKTGVDQAAYDATVAGIDSNNNGIRDDVELAIWKKYPNSAKIRAAELQYAMAIQLMLTKVHNTETWVAAAQEDSRGDGCIGLTTEDFHLYLSRTREVQALVVNTPSRKNAQDEVYNFTTSYGDLHEEPCDIDLNTLLK